MMMRGLAGLLISQYCVDKEEDKLAERLAFFILLEAGIATTGLTLRRERALKLRRSLHLWGWINHCPKIQPTILEKLAFPDSV
jgi:hypothetical protein